MAQKKTVVVRTQPQEVEIEGNIINNDELRELYGNIMGGHGDRTTAELLRLIAKEYLNKDVSSHAQLIRACHYRATCLDDAAKNVKDMIWPPEEADKVLEAVAEAISDKSA